LACFVTFCELERKELFEPACRATEVREIPRDREVTLMLAADAEQTLFAAIKMQQAQQELKA
jgi:hypothetical protein